MNSTIQQLPFTSIWSRNQHIFLLVFVCGTSRWKQVLHILQKRTTLHWRPSFSLMTDNLNFCKKKLFMIIWLVVSVHSVLLGNIIFSQAKPMLLKLSCNIYLIERCRIAYRFLVLATCADCRQAVSHKLIK